MKTAKKSTNNSTKTLANSPKVTKSALKADIYRNARALKIPLRAADLLAEESATKLMAWVSQRSAVTEDDLNRQAAKILKKYNEDLAYVYENRGKVI